ncbi:MAG: dinitrogenase iron-molybdenum cofactor biosynthesis protein [Oscillospiraceae bacterium]|jgi:predicted Fe-Mo cluster-binding NifX family protein|nr:dinitrogenase iron-molybdenum cofactor biosynthesis protein [Oscillospiraceae bacterium]
MSIRIAAATTDGKIINEHFGRASAFYIVELDESGYRFMEKRETAPVCGGGSHDDGAMAKNIALLDDCRAVLVSRAGPGAKRALELQGISVFEIGLPIDEALDKLRAYYYKMR